MTWLILAILGAWGSGWPRDPEDYWPKWCIACRLILGGLSAIVINMLAPIGTEAGFTGMAVMAFASGYVGSRLLGDLFGRVGMTPKR